PGPHAGASRGVDEVVDRVLEPATLARRGRRGRRLHVLRARSSRSWSRAGPPRPRGRALPSARLGGHQRSRAGGRGRSDGSGLAAPGPDDLGTLLAAPAAGRGSRLRIALRLPVHDRARLGATAVGATALVRRGPGRDAAALADATLVQHLDARSGERLPKDPIEVPLVMLDDEDPPLRGWFGVMVLTPRVVPTFLHGTEPRCQGNRALAVAPGAGLLDGEAVAVQANSRLRERECQGSNARSGHGHATPRFMVQGWGHEADET